jgi:hypothetical protein
LLVQLVKILIKGENLVSDSDDQNRHDKDPHILGERADSPIIEDDHSHSELNAGTSDPTDGRSLYQWASRYPPQAKKKMLLEATYLFVILLISYLIILSIWKGWIVYILSFSQNEAIVFDKYGYFLPAGLLGGDIFAIKYFYRAVARGFWHEDRRYWRLMSPFVGMSISFIIGMMINCNLISTQGPLLHATTISIGFLAGYLADDVAAKMIDIANAIFGTSARTKTKDDK